MLLESFQQYLRANESLKRENSALLRKGKMYDELVRKNRALEAKMTQMQASLDMQGGVATGRGQGSAVAAAEKTVAELKEELKQVKGGHSYGCVVHLLRKLCKLPYCSLMWVNVLCANLFVRCPCLGGVCWLFP